MFKPERVFSIVNPTDGLRSWFFEAREGNVGPYSTKEEAVSMLHKFIGACVHLGRAGGRERQDNGIFPEVQLQNLSNTQSASIVWHLV